MTDIEERNLAQPESRNGRILPEPDICNGLAEKVAYLATLNDENNLEPAERERRERVRTAAYHGRTCGECGADLDDDEPVWRVTYRMSGLSLFGMFESPLATAPVCATCWTTKGGPLSSLHLCGDSYARADKHPPMQPCAGCRRWVCTGGDYFRRQVTCSERCRLDARRREREERQQERRARCQVCGNDYQPSRSDSRYCSSACRQKAYRQRQAEDDGRNAPPPEHREVAG